MSFKEQALADLSTFLDVGEFGDTVDFDGVTMACVLDGDEAPNSNDDVTVLESTLYTRASNFDTSPVVRQRVVINGRPADVMRVDEQQGMLVIRLQWFSS